jgi:hypothetical protein
VRPDCPFAGLKHRASLAQVKASDVAGPLRRIGNAAPPVVAANKLTDCSQPILRSLRRGRLQRCEAAMIWRDFRIAA